MAGTTPNLNLYLPGGGSTGTYTPDEVADIDPLNQNFVKLDTFAGTVGVQTSRNQQFYGLAAGISSVTGMKLGDEYQESDAGKALWRYDGSNWVLNQPGSMVIRPTSVTGGTLQPSTGVVVADAGSKAISFNGVFSAKYRRYRLDYQYYSGTPNGSQLRFRNAGVDYAGLNYGYQVTYNNTDNTLVTAHTSNNGAFGIAATARPGHFGWIELNNPANGDTAQYTQKVILGMDGYSNDIAHFAGLVAGADAQTFDGVTFYLSSPELGPWFGWFKLTAIA
jgi:hypothetical protein